jgi:non-heme chloroperoxidase
MTAEHTDAPQTTSRRKVLLAGVGAVAAAVVGPPVAASTSDAKPMASASNSHQKGAQQMSMITTKDGTKIYYKDWGKGQPVVFSHGWPLNADAWDGQMLFLLQKGYRVIAHDRRGHGRSDQPGFGNNMDQYADDFSELMEKLDLKHATLVGHSTGGGEVAHYIGRHGSKRVAKVVLVSAVPPLMLKTEANPGGLPIEVFDGIRKGVLDNRTQLFKDFSLPFYGYNRPGAKISEGVRDSFWYQGMQGSVLGLYECIKQFSEVDYTPDLKKIDVPTLIIQGDDDQVVPIAESGMMSVKIVKNATLKVYKGAPHGLPTTHQDQLNADLLEFLQA